MFFTESENKKAKEGIVKLKKNITVNYQMYCRYMNILFINFIV
jgi:hypothetical protein